MFTYTKKTAVSAMQPGKAAQQAPAQRRLAAPAALLLILALGAALRLWLLSHDVPTLDSDESMVGLMSLHILRGEWTVFLWGQQYMGSLEAILIAPFLWLFGPSAVALRLAPMLLGLGFVATVYAICAQLISRTAGLLAAAFLALGPPFFVVLSVRAYGGYVETLLFGNLLLLLALRGPSPAGKMPAVQKPRLDLAPVGKMSALQKPRLLAWLFGLVAGLALWTDMLIAPYLLAASAIFWWQRRRDLLRGNGVLLLAGILLGAAPAIVYNILNQGVTIVTLLGLTLVGAPGAHTTPGLLLNNLWLELTVSLPVLLGGFIGGTQATGLSATAYESLAATHPLAYALGLLLVAVVLGLLVSAAISLLRNWRVLRLPKPTGEAPEPPAPTREQMRVQGEAALLLVTLCYLAVFCFNKQGLFAIPRYLFPLYSATPLLASQLARLAGWLRARQFSLLRLPALRVGLCTLALAGVLLWNVAGASAVTPLQTAARDHGVWIAGTDQTLLALLRADNIHTVISNDYWEGLRLTFESGESIITVMITSEGQPGFNRYPPYVTQGLADPRPAYLELFDTREALLDSARLQAGLLPGYRSVSVGAFVLFLPT